MCFNTVLFNAFWWMSQKVALVYLHSKQQNGSCVVNIISKMTNHSELFQFLIVDMINGAGS